jgi:hypothetical protein
MLLNERQQKAQALSREMAKMDGVWVTSPMPLDDRARLRFQVLDSNHNEVLQTLTDWGWEPAFVSLLPRVTFTGMQSAACYEIDIPQRQVIVDDRRIPDAERASDKKMSDEVRAIIDEWRGKKAQRR